MRLEVRRASWPTPFAMVPIRIIEAIATEARGLGSLPTMIGLLSYARPGFPLVYPSQTTVAKRLGLAPRTVSRQLGDLCRLGLIKDLGAYYAPGRKAHTWEIAVRKGDVPFGQVPVCCLAALQASRGLALGVFAVLCAYRTSRSNRVWPSQGTVAKHLHVTTRAVRYALSELESVGAVVRVGWAHGGVVKWELNPWFTQSAEKTVQSGSEYPGSDKWIPTQEAPHATSGTQCLASGGVSFLQVDNEHKKTKETPTAERALYEQRLREDCGWFWGDPCRERRISEVLDGLEKQGFEPQVVDELLAVAVGNGAPSLGRQVLDWVLLGEVAERLGRESATVRCLASSDDA